jgi:hypothetical protein
MALAIITAIFALFSATVGLVAFNAEAAAVAMNEATFAPRVAQSWTRTVNTLGRWSTWGRMSTWAGPRMVEATQITNMKASVGSKHAERHSDKK